MTAPTPADDEGALHILLADDEPLSSMALRSQLEALGHSVDIHARNGTDAVNFARCFLVDLAIIDYRMPGITGLDAANHIFRNRPMPLLLVSGHAEPDTDDDERPPAYAYLLKPADLRTLQQAIHHALACFHTWLRNEADPDDVDRKTRDARTIDQARRILQRDMSPRDACRALIRQSRNRHLDLLTTARNILQDPSATP